MATLRDLALAWSEAMDERYPDMRAFTAQSVKAMFDAAATLEIDDGADLPTIPNEWKR